MGKWSTAVLSSLYLGLHGPDFSGAGAGGGAGYQAGGARWEGFGAECGTGRGC